MSTTNQYIYIELYIYHKHPQAIVDSPYVSHIYSTYHLFLFSAPGTIGEAPHRGDQALSAEARLGAEGAQRLCATRWAFGRAVVMGEWKVSMEIHDPQDPCMLYMATFTINIPQMLAYIPYMDPMGDGLWFNQELGIRPWSMGYDE